MSRRTHGLVALLATATLVALLIAWWASDRDPVEPTTTPTRRRARPRQRPSSTSAASSSAPAPPTGPPAVVVPGATHLALSSDRRHGAPDRGDVQHPQRHRPQRPPARPGRRRDRGGRARRGAAAGGRPEPAAQPLRRRGGLPRHAAGHAARVRLERRARRAAGRATPSATTAPRCSPGCASRAGPTPCCRTARAASNAASSTWCCGSGVGRSASTTPTSTTPRPACGSSRCASPATSSASTATPSIFGGDFNASAGSATLALALDPAHTDLVDPWPLVGDGDGLTAPNNAPRSRIDFLLADDDWRPTVMATWQSAVSDHRGVVGRFLLRSPRVCR